MTWSRCKSLDLNYTTPKGESPKSLSQRNRIRRTHACMNEFEFATKFKDYLIEPVENGAEQD